MSLQPGNEELAEKHVIADPPALGEHKQDGQFVTDPEHVGETNELHRKLQGRHMQMIAMQVERTPNRYLYTDVCI